MTVRLELKPEIEASLNAQAEAKGIPLEAYLESIIEDLARATAAPATNLEEVRETLDILADMGRNLPHMSSAAFSRESIYQDQN